MSATFYKIMRSGNSIVTTSSHAFKEGRQYCLSKGWFLVSFYNWFMEPRFLKNSKNMIFQKTINLLKIPKIRTYHICQSI